MKQVENHNYVGSKTHFQLLSVKFSMLLICTLWSGTIAHAQIKPMINRGKTRALVVGISTYQNNKIPALQFAHKDAEAFATFLEKETAWKVAPEDMVLLTNEEATYGKFLSELKALFDECQPEDRFILYFSGHGDVETARDEKTGYLLFYDSSPTTYSSSSACKVTTLNKVISDLVLIKETEVLLITDACRSGELAGSGTGGPGQTTAALSELFANTTKFLSCGPNEFSVEDVRWGGGRGLFSYHLINGFKGLADNNPLDRYVDFFELQRYVEDSVRWDSQQKQTPIAQGRRDRKLAKIIPRIKDQLQQQLSPPVFATQAPSIPAPDTSILEKFTLFEEALTKKHLMFPRKGSAAQIYHSIGDDGAALPFKKVMKISLTAALQDEAQRALNEYIQSPAKELSKRWANVEVYTYYPDYLGLAAQLLGKESYFYDEIKSKEYYFRGVNLRLKADQLKDRDTLIKLALEQQHEALRLKPHDAPHIYNELGLLSRRLGQKQEELSYFQEAHTLSPRWGLALTNLAITHRRLENYEEAEKLYKQAIELDESLAISHNNLGTLYLKMGKYELAELSFEKATDLDPSLVTSYYNLAYIYLEDSTKLRDAEKALNKYLFLRPDDVDAYNLLGYTYMEMQLYEDGERTLKEALKLDQNYFVSLFNLIYLYQISNQYEKAITLSKKANEKLPNNKDLLFQMVEILALDNQVQKAMHWLEKLLKTGLADFDYIDESPHLGPLKESQTYHNLMSAYFPDRY